MTGVGKEPAKVKIVLKDQAKLLENNSKELFGEKFRKHNKEMTKAKEDSKKIYAKPKEQRPPAENRSQNKRPFQKGPSTAQTHSIPRQVGGGGQQNYGIGGNRRRFPAKQTNLQGKYGKKHF